MGLEDARAQTKLGNTEAGLKLVHRGTQKRSIQVRLRLQQVLMSRDYDQTGKRSHRHQEVFAVGFRNKNGGRSDAAKAVAGTNKASLYVEPVALRVHSSCKVGLVAADARRESRLEPLERTPLQSLD